MQSPNDFNGYFVGTMAGNLMSGYDIMFGGANTATFSTNIATDNITAGYSTTGTPSVGINTGNGSADTL